jgi:ubiquinone/menaquinone biosynthesis C-methylase UbiE
MSGESEHTKINAHKWNVRAETFDAKRFDYFRWMQRRTISFLHIAPGIRFLDLGCGTGYAVRYVAAEAKGEGVFCGIDISPRMIEIARAGSSGSRNVRYEVANAEELPLDSEFFDAVICTNSFHHYLHPAEALSEIRRVLSPGGKVCILDVTADSRLVRFIDGLTRRKEPEHVRFYSTAEYAQLFEEAGLQRMKATTILPPVKVHVAAKGAKPTEK